MSERLSTPESGIHFRAINGRRSSQIVGRRVIAAAVQHVDAELADRMEAADNWRKDYLGAVREAVNLSAHSAKNALRVASDGLDALHKHFTVERDGESRSLEEAFAAADARFMTHIVEGTGTPVRDLEIPHNAESLRADALRRQLDEWRAKGIIEPSCASALETVIANPDWLDLRDVHVALLGAASEMGPLEWLTRWGAEISAIDLPVEHLWQRILGFAARGSGRVRIPVRTTATTQQLASVAGADLIAEAPDISSWLAESGTPLVLGNHVYADGAHFVRVAVAADAIANDLIGRGALKGYAYLASPTEVYSVPREVVDASRSEPARFRHRLLRAATRDRLFSPNYSTIWTSPEREWGLFDCLVPQQGANYALAKTLQRWRAAIAREQGVMTSANIAPATRTKSVVKNRILSAAYAGAGAFGVEVFEPETSRALMAALLVHDIRNGNGVAHPQTPLDHPFDLFPSGAAHGGLWRMRYAPRSVLPLAVVLGYPRDVRIRRRQSL